MDFSYISLNDNLKPIVEADAQDTLNLMRQHGYSLSEFMHFVDTLQYYVVSIPFATNHETD